MSVRVQVKVKLTITFEDACAGCEHLSFPVHRSYPVCSLFPTRRGPRALRESTFDGYTKRLPECVAATVPR